VSGCVAPCVTHLVWTTARSNEYVVTHDVPYCEAHMDADVLRRLDVYCVTGARNTHVF
jgi:coenzyme F420-reducing hydrogenase gamma subunit